jgi:hypothetical protein
MSGEKNPAEATLTMSLVRARGLVTSWPMPLVRDERKLAWQTDEEVCVLLGFALIGPSAI